MGKSIFLSSFVLFVALVGCKKSTHEYTVQMRGSVPFLHVDGKPVRNRMFYSNVPGTTYQNIDTHERIHNIEFTSPVDSNDATISLNFGAVIKDIWISELALENLTDKTKKSIYDFSVSPVDKNLFSNWTVKALEAWRDYSLGFSNTAPDTTLYPTAPYKAENKDGILHIEKSFVDMSIPRNQGKIHDIERINFCIKNIAFEKGKKYRLVVKLHSNIKGRFEVLVYDSKTLDLIGKNSQETFMTTEKYASQVGINFVSFGVPAFWKDEEFCKKLVDSRFQPVIKANPNVKIIVRLGLEPPNEWLDANPDEVMQNKDGTFIERGHVRFPFPASEVYRRDAVSAMKKFIKYVEEKYPNNIAGYHPSGGQTSEWFYGGVNLEKGFNGYSPAIKKAWKKWLKEKYQTDEALQKAWRSTTATIEGATVPTEEERKNLHHPLINPETSWHVVDFNYFLQDSMCDMILLAMRTIRETAPKGRLCVAFYGYGQTAATRTSRRGPAYSGHLALRKALNSPDVDVFTAPISYKERQFGGMKCVQAPTETASLAGKIWFDEDDTRTWLAPESGSPPYVLDKLQTNREITKKVLRRNMAQQTLKNVGSWWMDLFGCGWYLDRELWNVMNEFKEIENEFIENPSLYVPEIALTYDEVSMRYLASQPHHLRTSALTVVALAERSIVNGSPMGYYLFDDILENKVCPKLHYVSASYALNKKQRELLRKSEERMTNVYLWTVGYIDLDNRKFSLGAIEGATGFKVELAGKTKPLAIPTEEGKKLGLSECGDVFDLDLLFSPIPQKNDVVLARYPNGKPAIVVRYGGKYPQIFCGITALNQKTTACFEKIAGVHSYVDNNAVSTVNANYVCFHTTKDGKHTLTLKDEAEVYDVLEKKNLGRFKTKVFDLKMGDVKLFKLKK